MSAERLYLNSHISRPRFLGPSKAQGYSYEEVPHHVIPYPDPKIDRDRLRGLQLEQTEGVERDSPTPELSEFPSLTEKELVSI